VKHLYLHNLGCSKNQIDGEMIAGWAEYSGISLTEYADQADVIVINTCAFIKAAKEEAIEAILEAAKYKEEGKCDNLYVCGCFPELYKTELKADLPEVDGLYGIDQWQELLKEIVSKDVSTGSNPHLKRHLWTPDHYSHIRIADGCDRGCTYCVIPKIRGSYRSRQPADIIEEAKQLAANGVKELLPVAQELNSYGHDIDDGKGNAPLIALLRSLCAIEELDWIRPLYLHPPACDADLLEFWAGEAKLCRYLDLPIEHASNRILKAMGRGGLKDQIRKTVNLARELMDDVVIRTSIIVGFPGETDDDFNELLDFVSEIKFDRLGSFQYSREDGTYAANIQGQVHDELKDERQQILMTMQADISEEINLSRVGSIEDVYIDRYEEESGYSIAHSRKEMPELDGEILINGRFPLGSRISVEIESATEYDIFARPV